MEPAIHPAARIVIVAYRSAAVLPRCLAALAVQTRRDFEVVVVDNSSGDAALRGLALPDARFSLQVAGDNLGFAGGSNFGARSAGTDWIVTLNPDAVPEPDWFARLMDAARRHPGAASLGSALVSDADPRIWDGLGDAVSVYGLAWRGAQGWPRERVDVSGRCLHILSPCAAAAAYRRTAFEACGGFDPAFFAYLEDVDLGLRLQLRAHSSLLVGDAVVRHIGGASSDGPDPSRTLYLTQRNTLRLIVKTYPGWLLPLALALRVPTSIYLAWRTRGQPGAPSRRRGRRDGLAGWRGHWEARRTVQRTREVSTFGFARKLVWSPRSVGRKSPHVLDADDPVSETP